MRCVYRLALTVSAGVAGVVIYMAEQMLQPSPATYGWGAL